MRMARVLSSAVLLAALASFAVAQEYQVNLAPALKAGFKYHKTATAKTHTALEVKMGAQVLQSQTQDMNYDFEGDLTVLEVDAKGQTTKVNVRIVKLTQSTPAGAANLLPEGTEVVAAMVGAKPTFTSAGSPVAPSVETALIYFADLSAGEVTMDDALGTKTPRKVGDTWPVDKDALARAMSAQSQGAMNISPDDVSGDVKLAGVTKVDNVECLAVEAVVKLTNMDKAMGMGQMAPGATFDKAEGTITLSAKCPVSATAPALENSSHSTVALHGTIPTAPGQPSAQMSTDIVQDSSAHITLAGA